MTSEMIVDTLKKAPLFQGLHTSQIRDVARLAERILFRPGETIIEEGVVGEAAIVLVSGTAIRVSGPELGPRGEEVVEGSMIGEMAMLIESEHSSTVIARTPVKALKINRSDLLEHMANDRNLADHFVQVIVGRLTDMAHELRAVEETLSSPVLIPPSATRGGSIGPQIPAPH
jgi:CRP-like cAMP-binding protein